MAQRPGGEGWVEGTPGPVIDAQRFEVAGERTADKARFPTCAPAAACALQLHVVRTSMLSGLLPATRHSLADTRLLPLLQERLTQLREHHDIKKEIAVKTQMRERELAEAAGVRPCPASSPRTCSPPLLPCSLPHLSDVQSKRQLLAAVACCSLAFIPAQPPADPAEPALVAGRMSCPAAWCPAKHMCLTCCRLPPADRGGRPPPRAPGRGPDWLRHRRRLHHRHRRHRRPKAGLPRPRSAPSFLFLLLCFSSPLCCLSRSKGALLGSALPQLA